MSSYTYQWNDMYNWKDQLWPGRKGWALSFPAKAGPHLPTPEGWQAELAWVAGYTPR